MTYSTDLTGTTIKEPTTVIKPMNTLTTPLPTEPVSTGYDAAGNQTFVEPTSNDPFFTGGNIADMFNTVGNVIVGTSGNTDTGSTPTNYTTGYTVPPPPVSDEENKGISTTQIVIGVAAVAAVGVGAAIYLKKSK